MGRLAKMSGKKESLESLLDFLYLAAADPSAWPEFLGSVARIFDASIAGLIAQRPGQSRYTTAAAVGKDDKSVYLYNEHYSLVDPWYLALQAGRIQEWIGRGSDLCSQGKFGGTEFYGDFWKSHTRCWYQGGIFQGEKGQSSVLTFHRSRGRGDFSDEDVRLMQDLCPHLRRALSIHRKVVDLRSSTAQAAGAVDALDVGLIAVGQDRRVRFANAQGEAVLRAGNILAARNGELVASPNLDSRTQSALEKLVVSGFSRSLGVLAGGTIGISNGGRNLLVTVLPSNRYPVLTEPVVLLMIVDPDAQPGSRHRLLASVFGLTPAEARVAMMLLEGLDPNEIAVWSRSTPGTVRFQLKMIYRKTGVNRQSQLVRLLSRLPGSSEPGLIE